MPLLLFRFDYRFSYMQLSQTHDASGKGVYAYVCLHDNLKTVADICLTVADICFLLVSYVDK